MSKSWLKIKLTVSLFVITCILQGCSSQMDKSWRIGVDPNWSTSPFGKQTPLVNGFTEDILLEVAGLEKMKFEKIPIRGEDLVDKLSRGEVDAILSPLETSSYEKEKYLFSENFLDIGPICLLPQTSPYKKWSQIQKGTVGLLSGDLAITLVPNSLFIQYSQSIPELLDRLAAGDLTAVLLAVLPAEEYQKDLYRKLLKRGSKPLTQAGLRLVTNKKEIEIVAPFDRALTCLKKKGRYQQLYQKWFTIAPSQKDLKKTDVY